MRGGGGGRRRRSRGLKLRDHEREESARWVHFGSFSLKDRCLWWFGGRESNVGPMEEKRPPSSSFGFEEERGKRGGRGGRGERSPPDCAIELERLKIIYGPLKRR